MNTYTRLLLATLLVLLPLAGEAAPRVSKPIAECAQHLPYGVPKSAKTETTLICREGYALEHDNRAKIPAWVAYTLTPTTAVGCTDRAAGFRPSPDIARGQRAETRDYAKSGYDIGHMANSADMRSSAQLSEESNLLDNAAPQLPGLNRAAWKSLETRARTWAVGRNSSILIYVGPIYELKGVATIGPGRVVVPSAFYKVLVDQRTRDVLAFIYPHQASRSSPPAFKTSLAEVQRQTGIIFPMPPRARLAGAIWPVTGSGTLARAAACPAK